MNYLKHFLLNLVKEQLPFNRFHCLLRFFGFQSFNTDLNDKRNAVKDIINKCNKMLRETTNAQTDEIKNRLEDIKSQVSAVKRQNFLKNYIITCTCYMIVLPIWSH